MRVDFEQMLQQPDGDGLYRLPHRAVFALRSIVDRLLWDSTWRGASQQQRDEIDTLVAAAIYGLGAPEEEASGMNAKDVLIAQIDQAYIDNSYTTQGTEVFTPSNGWWAAGWTFDSEYLEEHISGGIIQGFETLKSGLYLAQFMLSMTQAPNGAYIAAQKYGVLPVETAQARGAVIGGALNINVVLAVAATPGEMIRFYISTLNGAGRWSASTRVKIVYVGDE